MSVESSAFQQRFDASRRPISPFSSDLTESDSTQLVELTRPQTEVSWLPSINVGTENTARDRANLPEPAWAARTATEGAVLDGNARPTADAMRQPHDLAGRTTDTAIAEVNSAERRFNRLRLEDLPAPAWRRDSRHAATTDHARSTTNGTALDQQERRHLNHDERANNRDTASAAADLVDTREDLLRQVDERFNTPELRERHDRFLDDMATFEQRSRARGLSSQEISNTYAQISRIMNADASATPSARMLTADQRLAVASQVMHNAAAPSDIRQNRNTCGVTSLETRLYTRNPSSAARLVADVATTGSFTGTDGTTVTLDPESMLPSQVGTDDMQQESQTRTLASQLFQVTAANIANRQDTSRGEFQYVQRQPGNKESGEQLLDVSTNPPQVIGDAPGLAGWINGLVGVERSITGDTSGGSYIYGGQMGRRASEGFQIDSADALGERLETLSESGQLPAVVFVHADSAMFNPGNDRQPEDLNGDGHYVTVTGYDPVTRTVRYDDQYDRESDHNELGVPLEQFYNSTHMVSANERLDRLEARYDDQIEAVNGPRQTTDDSAARENELAQDLSVIGSTFVQRWRSVDEGRYADFETPQDRQRAVNRIIALAQSLPEDRRRAVIASLDPAPPVK